MPNLVLRSTLYTSPQDPSPMTIVVRADDLARPIRQAAEALERDSIQWGFVVTDIFEVSDKDYESPVRTTFLGMARLEGERARAEVDMCISYFWNLDQLPLIRPGGFLANPGRAPLTVDQIQAIMLRLSLHPHYKQQTLIFRAEDDRTVTFRDGKFVVKDPPRATRSALPLCDPTDESPCRWGCGHAMKYHSPSIGCEMCACDPQTRDK
jgi:hypothetical protein